MTNSPSDQIGKKEEGSSRDQSPSTCAAPLASELAGQERGVSGDKDVRRGLWRIYFDPPPIPVRDCDWHFVHDDYDASWEGEEDGWVSNGLAGHGASLADCLAQIADIEAERGQ